MNNIIGKVTPLTRAIIWAPADGLQRNSPRYKEIDYLLDGLLTATLNLENDFSSHLLLGKNFNFPLHVFIIRKFVPQEFEGFLTLVKKDLAADNSILVIDEANVKDEIVKNTHQDFQSFYQYIQ